MQLILANQIQIENGIQTSHTSQSRGLNFNRRKSTLGDTQSPQQLELWSQEMLKNMKQDFVPDVKYVQQDIERRYFRNHTQYVSPPQKFKDKQFQQYYDRHVGKLEDLRKFYEINQQLLQQKKELHDDLLYLKTVSDKKSPLTYAVIDGIKNIEEQRQSMKHLQKMKEQEFISSQKKLKSYEDVSYGDFSQARQNIRSQGSNQGHRFHTFNQSTLQTNHQLCETVGSIGSQHSLSPSPQQQTNNFHIRLIKSQEFDNIRQFRSTTMSYYSKQDTNPDQRKKTMNTIMGERELRNSQNIKEQDYSQMSFYGIQNLNQRKETTQFQVQLGSIEVNGTKLNLTRDEEEKQKQELLLIQKDIQNLRGEQFKDNYQTIVNLIEKRNQLIQQRNIREIQSQLNERIANESKRKYSAHSLYRKVMNNQLGLPIYDQPQLQLKKFGK